MIPFSGMSEWEELTPSFGLQMPTHEQVPARVMLLERQAMSLQRMIAEDRRAREEQSREQTRAFRQIQLWLVSLVVTMFVTAAGAFVVIGTYKERVDATKTMVEAIYKERVHSNE